MIKYEITNANVVVDAFDPSHVIAVCFSSADAKKIRDLLNKSSEKSREKDTSRQELINLRAKMARWQKILEENDLMPKRGRKPNVKRTLNSGSEVPATEKVKQPRAKKQFKEKTCPGYKREPHTFTPTAGNQTHCPECRRLLVAEKANYQRPAPKSNVKTETRSSHGGPGSNVVRIPTIEEVLAIKDIEERRKWEARWSPAERQQAQIIKTRLERERWKAMRQRGQFAMDDPLMGMNGSLSNAGKV